MPDRHASTGLCDFIEELKNEILEITGQSILESAGGLPREEEPIAALAVETLQTALQNFLCKR